MSSCLPWPRVGGAGTGTDLPPERWPDGAMGGTGPREACCRKKKKKKRQAAAWWVGGCGFWLRRRRAGPAREPSVRAGAQACGDKQTEGFLPGRLTEALAPATASRDLQHKKKRKTV